MSNSSVAQATSTLKTDNKQPNMLAWALRYNAKTRAKHLLPLHTPIFDDDGTCTGCSCEAYKRSDRYHAWLDSQGRGERFDPEFKCKHPGKHPRTQRGYLDASADPDVIRAWWKKWPNANIGWVPGPDGMAALDADLYKDTFAGGDALTAEEQETPTSITGGLGNHLLYEKPDGATYTNAAGDLPTGIDVRADNGFIVLPPSIHPSGRRYHWEFGYGIHEIPALPLPDRIHQVLIQASAKVTNRTATFSTALRWDGTPSTARPTLDTWRISKEIRRIIETTPTRGGRSEADAKVCTALAYAGAGDDDILSVFEHYPCGTAGKFAERGRDYLARTIAAARAYVEAHPPPADVRHILTAIRNHIHQIDLADHDAGGRARERNLVAADAIIETFMEYGNGRLSGSLGMVGLRAKMNVGSYATVSKALDDLTGWFIERVETDEAGTAARVYRIAPSMVTMAETKVAQGVNTSNYGDVKEFTLCATFQHPTFAEYRHRDAFNATTTPITPEVIAKREKAGHPFSDRYTVSAEYRRRINAAFPAAGRTALVIVDALVNANGSAPVAHLVGLGGRSKHIVYRAIRRLCVIGLCKKAKRVVYLADDWREHLDHIEGQMPTDGTGRRRMVRESAHMLASADEAIDAGNAPEWQHRRRKRAEAALERLAPRVLRMYEQERRTGRVMPSGAAHLGKNGSIHMELVHPDDREAWIEVFMADKQQPAAPAKDVAASVAQGRLMAMRCMGDYGSAA